MPTSVAERAAVEELRAALDRRPLPEIPCKHFYDEAGSALFEEITRLPEYYPTRTEEAILEAEAPRIVAAAGARRLAELGSGAGRKVRLLLHAMSRRGALEGVTLFDINRVVLAESIRGLSREFPGVEFQGIAGDFERDLARLGPGGGRLVVFLAGTIGNLAPEAVPGFLRSVASQMAPGDAFLVGVDLLKDPARLHAAYNDAAGVTARFNRNILRVVNRRFDADFDPEAFEHRAFFDAERAWIEMRLVARRATRARVGALARVYEFRVGDEIRTEISCKYSRESFERRTTGTGLAIESWTTDPERLFALALLKRGSGTLPA